MTTTVDVTIGQQQTSAKSAIAVDFDFPDDATRGALTGKFADIRVNDKNITTTAGASHYRVSLLELYDQSLEIGGSKKRATSVIEQWALQGLVKGTTYAVAVSASDNITLVAGSGTTLSSNVASRNVTIVGLASLAGGNVLATFSKAGPAEDAKLNIELSGLTEVLMGYNTKDDIEFHFAVEGQDGGFGPLNVVKVVTDDTTDPVTTEDRAYKNWDGSLSQQFQSIANDYNTDLVYRVQVYAISTFLGPSGQAVTKQVAAYVPTVKPSPANLEFQDDTVVMTFAANPDNFPEDSAFTIQLFEAEKNVDGDWVKKAGGSALTGINTDGTKSGDDFVKGEIANYLGTASLKMAASGDYIYSLKYNDGFEQSGAVEVHFAFTLFPITPTLAIAKQTDSVTGTGANRVYNAVYQVTKVPADDNSLTVTGLELRVTVQKKYDSTGDGTKDADYSDAALAEAEAALKERAGANWVEPEEGDKYWKISISYTNRVDTPNLHTISLAEKYWYYAFDVNAALFVETVRSQAGYTPAAPVDTQGSATDAAAELEGDGPLPVPAAPTVSLRDNDGNLVSVYDNAPENIVTAAFVSVPNRKPHQSQHHNFKHKIYYNEEELVDGVWTPVEGKQDQLAITLDAAVDDTNQNEFGTLIPYTTLSGIVSNLTLNNRYFFYQTLIIASDELSESNPSAMSAAFMPKREARAPLTVGTSAEGMTDLRNVTITFGASPDEVNLSGAAITGYAIEVRDAMTDGNLVALAGNTTSKNIAATNPGEGELYSALITLAADVIPGRQYYAFVKATGAGLAAAAFGSTNFASQGVPIIVTNSLNGVGNVDGLRSIVLNNQGAIADAVYIMAFAEEQDKVLAMTVSNSNPGAEGSTNLLSNAASDDNSDYTFTFELLEEGGTSYAGNLSMIVIILSTSAGSAYKQLV